MPPNVLRAPFTDVYHECKWFQAHLIADINGQTPTDKTQVPLYLFDYPTMGAIFNTLYLNIGDNPVYLNQILRISGHMEYKLRNQTNDVLPIQLLHWRLRKPIPRKTIGIDLTPTVPIYTGNILNLMGRAIFDFGAATSQLAGVVPDALNTNMNRAALDMHMFPIMEEFLDFKIRHIKLGVGKSRVFKVGRRLLNIDSKVCFATVNTDVSANGFTDPGAWSQSFIPGAEGYCFRIEGTPAMFASPLTQPRTDYTPIVYSSPEVELETKAIYTVFDWLGQPEYSMNTLSATKGIQANTLGNPTASIVNIQGNQGQVVVA